MKLGPGKRILMLIHWLVSLGVFVVFALDCVVPQVSAVPDAVKSAFVEGSRIKPLVIACIVFYLALAALQLSMLIASKRRTARGLISIEANDSNRISVSISAIEQMVRQALSGVDGITDIKIGLDGSDGSVEIAINASVVSGSHIPSVSSEMKRAIRQSVESESGIRIEDLAINIEAITEKKPVPIFGRFHTGKKSSKSAAERRDSGTETFSSTLDLPAEGASGFAGENVSADSEGEPASSEKGLQKTAFGATAEQPKEVFSESNSIQD